MALPPGLAKFVADRKASSAQITATKAPTPPPAAPSPKQLAPRAAGANSGPMKNAPLMQGGNGQASGMMFHGHTVGKGK